jgi:hypothetical protein
MKVYIITEKDIQDLLVRLDRNPTYGKDGGSHQSLSHEELKVLDDAHSFYNYQIRSWIQDIKSDKS